ncbi:MAG: iron ABC transporter permease [Humidesulfovibrio sp.]|uniref:FecCD family ABC transporter permease n=1 Tax=Humidesulfovibrio sp. TaxID=2910988 RepID=UPI0027331629|nr:iron ABC transporter permease [Humidesulfovibrio sp.]MDP2847755.1 iron ABC transporter permease [Humidesulfovibrio sp.]
MMQQGGIPGAKECEKRRDVCPAWLRACALASALLVSLLLTVVLACAVGSYPSTVGESLRALLQAAGFAAGEAVDPSLSVVIVDIRLARVLLAGLTGASLAIAGAAFQGVLRNPLADSFTLGVSGGAAFGASVAIISGMAGEAALSGDARALPACALVGALTALALVLGLSRAGGGPLSGLRRETVVLAGIVVSTFLSALISLLKSLDEESVASIVFWIMGSFQGRGFEHAELAWPYMLVGAAIVFWRARELDVLALGETQARMLGLEAGRSRLWLLLAASLLSGAAVAVSGVIGFVGLVVPHLVRLVLGAGHRRLLPASALLGALLLIWSDVAARSVLPGGAELPVGVVTALIGGPFFCLILARKGLKNRGEA